MKEILSDIKILPVIEIAGNVDPEKLIGSLIDGNINVIEITLRNKIAFKHIALIIKKFPEMNNLSKKLKYVKLVVLDFDGVFTDGGIYLNDKSQSFRRFDVKDGLGIKLLQKNDFKIAIISGSNSPIIDERAKALGIKIVRKGISCKLKTLNEIQGDLNIKVELMA